MLRSLWAGVSGLQAHQIALDVEGNNIANVNTAGFKYSRTNFSDLLSQTSKIATAPQGQLGGKNPMQVGLGTQVSSITKIFKQGSTQTTDKNTDLAIEGDGFFVVSPDGGNTYKYTRNGNFNFDALGNFTDGNGYIVQGWMRDPTTNKIDSTTPIQNITIPPGLTTPANDTSFISLKANLNAGNKVVNKSTIYSLDQYHGWVDTNGNGIQETTEQHRENGTSATDARFNVSKNMYERGEDFGSLFNSTGESFALSEGQGAWVSYADSKYASTSVSNASGITVDMTINGVQIGGPTSTYTSTSTISSAIQEDNMRYIQDLINAHTSETGVQAATGSGGITLVNSNQLGTEATKKNMKITVNNANDNTNLLDIAGGASNILDITTAFQYTYTKNSASTASLRSAARTFHTTEDLRNAMQTDARKNTDYLGNGWVTPSSNLNDGVTVAVNSQGQFEVTNKAGDAFNATDGDVITALDTAGNAWTLTSANLITKGSFVTANGTTNVHGSTLTNATIKGATYYVPRGATYTVNGITKTSNGLYTDTIAAGTVASTIDLSAVASSTVTSEAHLLTLTAPTTNGDTLTWTDNQGNTATATWATGDTAAQWATKVATAIGGLAGYGATTSGNNVSITGSGLTPNGTSFTATSALSGTGGASEAVSTAGIRATALPSTSTYILNGTTGGVLNEDTFFPPVSVLASGADTITVGPSGTTLPEGTTYQINNSGTVLTAGSGGAPITAGTILSDLTLPSTAGATFTTGTTFSNNITTVNAGTNTKTINDFDTNLTITGLSNTANKISENQRFGTTMKTLQGALPTGNNVRASQGIYAASHASSIDVYDSLGSKHTVRLEFRKVGSTSDGGTQWNMIISVPEPGVINDTGFPVDRLTGSITFGSNGALSAFSPPSIKYTANNGSTPNQRISLNFGTAGQFDGMTSYDSQSNTSGIQQDGFPGGDLDGIRVDETGTLIGSFTNGRSFGLAQVSMARFTNNNALESDGGNTFIQTSNSGNAIIGQAAVGGRGGIRASALEMSNVDLSRSLTQLIIIQRGFQANSKTITTSDQILNTLLQLKQ